MAVSKASLEREVSSVLKEWRDSDSIQKSEEGNLLAWDATSIRKMLLSKENVKRVWDEYQASKGRKSLGGNDMLAKITKEQVNVVFNVHQITVGEAGLKAKSGPTVKHLHGVTTLKNNIWCTLKVCSSHPMCVCNLCQSCG